VSKFFVWLAAVSFISQRVFKFIRARPTTPTQTIGRLAIVIKVVKILEHACFNFYQGALWHSNSNKWKEILMNQVESTTKKATQKSAKGFTDEERAAMKERAKELKAATDKADGESAVLAKIAEMPEPDRGLSERLHAIIKASAPALSPKLWYGMPAYARDGKIVCFFQSGQKFKTRYATFGFSDTANLDEDGLWPVAFALKELTAANEARISALVKKAVS
jgi:uncharacterized protein YdhG (YjbR/CyaY superfamily)